MFDFLPCRTPAVHVTTRLPAVVPAREDKDLLALLASLSVRIGDYRVVPSCVGGQPACWLAAVPAWSASSPAALLGGWPASLGLGACGSASFLVFLRKSQVASWTCDQLASLFLSETSYQVGGALTAEAEGAGRGRLVTPRALSCCGGSAAPTTSSLQPEIGQSTTEP